MAATAGIVAVVGGVGVGTFALLRIPEDAASTAGSARHITVTTAAPAIPLNGAEVLALLRRPPDYGRLADPARRASCLTGLGYPAGTAVLGAQPVMIDGRRGVVLVLAGDTPDVVTATAVEESCSAADTGLLADTTVALPPATGPSG